MSSWIRSRSERWRGCLLLLALWGLAPRPVAAAELTEEAQAREKLQEGNLAYERGDFLQALKAFEGAYQLVSLPGFLFNVAQCQRQLGDFARAATSYRRYLSLSEEEPANAALVKELIAEMDAQAKQQATRRAGPERPTKASEVRGEPRKERPGLKGPGGKEPRSSRSLAVERGSLPPAAVPEAAAREEREPLVRKWWLWAGVGTAALVAGGILYAVTAPGPRPTTLGTIPGR